MMNNTKIPDYVKSIDKLPKEHPFYGREKDFIKLMNDDLPKEDGASCAGEENRMSEDDCPCQECGCIGNGSCGADCVDDEQACTLDSCCVCPCCNKLGKEENMKRWKNDE